uniref:Uncharacterized protein n=1 Tax=Glossina pallidipes TaxID=7398 RepID=A0A1A9Z7G8_GLOPL
MLTEFDCIRCLNIHHRCCVETSSLSDNYINLMLHAACYWVGDKNFRFFQRFSERSQLYMTVVKPHRLAKREQEQAVNNAVNFVILRLFL